MLLVLINPIIIHSQDQKGKVRKEKLSFGEVWFIEKQDDTIGDEGDLYNLEGIVEGSNYYAKEKTFYTSEFRSLLKATDLTSITTVFCEFIQPHLFNYNKTKDTIKPFIDFEYFKAKWVEISNNVFLNQIIFSLGSFDEQFHLIDNHFSQDLTFRSIRFNNAIVDSIYIRFETYMRVIGNTFDGNLILEDSDINSTIYFSDNELNRYTKIKNTTFSKYTSFSDSKFRGNTSFRNSRFKTMPEFNRIDFYDTLDLYSTYFENGVDLRRCNFDSTKKLILEKTDYPNGRLMIEWDQIKAREEFSISLDTTRSNSKDKYKRLVQVYEKLKYNYLEQGDKNSADNVSYELEQRKQELFRGFWQTIYGWTFGYGYEPLRYLVLVFLIMIFFAYKLYKKHYVTVFEIMDKGSEKEKPTIEKKNNLLGLPDYYQNFSGINDEKKWEKLPILTVLWHNIFMSTSLLIGLRFKREWIHKYDKKFLRFASFEWILGIVVYFIFIIFVKGQRFEFLKGIFGV